MYISYRYNMLFVKQYPIVLLFVLRFKQWLVHIDCVNHNQCWYDNIIYYNKGTFCDLWMSV